MLISMLLDDLEDEAVSALYQVQWDTPTLYNTCMLLAGQLQDQAASPPAACTHAALLLPAAALHALFLISSALRCVGP